MPAYTVVPPDVVAILAPALSSNPNTGAIIAEQLLRSESGGALVQKMTTGGKLTAQEKVQLPYLMPGHSWDAIAEKFAAAHADRVDLPPTT